MCLFKQVIILLVSSLLAACSPAGSPGDSSNPADQQKAGLGEPVQGRINGQSWAFRSGRAYFKKYQPSHIVIQLWNEDIAEPCKEKRGSILQVRLRAPKELATWNISRDSPLNPLLSMFFADLDFKPQPRDNMKADRGEITFTSIDNQFVGGHIVGSFQNPKVRGTRVAGDFVVPFCVSPGDNF
jgi:hypothetical protein